MNGDTSLIQNGLVSGSIEKYNMSTVEPLQGTRVKLGMYQKRSSLMPPTSPNGKAIVGAQYKTIEMNTDYKFKPDEVY
jgi:hypothetical protein